MRTNNFAQAGGGGGGGGGGGTFDFGDAEPAYFLCQY